LGLKPGYHQQPLRVYNSIASAFLVVGSGSAACHPHEHQQRRSVGCGLSPLLVFVQLALKPGFHQQHLRVYNSIASAFLVVGGGFAACHPHEHQQRRSVGFGLSPLVVFVQLALRPGFHQQPLRMYNSIASAFLVVGGGSAACHPHEHQQRRSVGFGLSPLLVFVQLALKPGFHQQHLPGVQFYCQRFCGCWWRLRCLPSPRTPTTAVSGLRAFAIVGVRAVGFEAGLSPTTLAGVQFYCQRFSGCW